MRYFIRKNINFVARSIPAPILRHFLKSIWHQPRLQDSLLFHVQPYRYESTIPTRFDTNIEGLSKRRNLPGLNLNTGQCLDLLARLKPFAQELASFPIEKKPGADFWFRNYGYEDFDAVTLYAIIRDLKPKRYIEVGSGFSSRVASLACRKNQSEGHPVESLFIEPYPSANLKEFKLSGKLLVEKVENVPLSTFKSLEAGDILFIDTTHIVKTQSDCCYELLEILPVLNPGVWIHIHDIFTPFDYPEEWLMDHLRSFNEQYAVEAILSNGQAFEVKLPLFFLWKEHRSALEPLMPQASARPAAFWIQKR